MGCDEVVGKIQKAFNFKEDKAIDYFQVYLSMKDMINWIKKTKKGTSDAFLISKQSIPNFSNIIFNSNILNKIYWKNELLEMHEHELKKNLSEYTLDKNIIFLSSYQECLKYRAEKDGKENEFIIVDEKFIKPMGLDFEDLAHKKVEIIIDNISGNYQIKFPNNVKKINFQEKKRGIYKFCSKSDNNTSIPVNDINTLTVLPSNIINIPRNESDNLSVKIIDHFDSKYLSEYLNNQSNRQCRIFCPSSNNNNH
jgi:hypothetical protein